MNWICKYCGADTSNVEYEYLDGHNHLSCTLKYLKTNEVKKTIKIENPHHINTKNYQMDGSIVEISYMGYEARTNATDSRLYFVYKFEGHKNTFNRANVIFELHTDITNDMVQFNIWKNGGMNFGSISVDTIKNRDNFILSMIKEVNEY